jgi:hypothetical protein
MLTFWAHKQRRGVSLPGGGSVELPRGFPIAPLAKIVADPLWRLLTKQEQKEIRMTHARALRDHRRG